MIRSEIWRTRTIIWLKQRPDKFIFVFTYKSLEGVWMVKKIIWMGKGTWIEIQGVSLGYFDDIWYEGLRNYHIQIVIPRLYIML